MMEVTNEMVTALYTKVGHTFMPSLDQQTRLRLCRNGLTAALAAGQRVAGVDELAQLREFTKNAERRGLERNNQALQEITGLRNDIKNLEHGMNNMWKQLLLVTEAEEPSAEDAGVHKASLAKALKRFSHGKTAEPLSDSGEQRRIEGWIQAALFHDGHGHVGLGTVRNVIQIVESRRPSESAES